MGTKNGKEEKAFVSEGEAARQLGVCRMTLHRLRHAGRIGHYRIGTKVLYTQQQIDDFLAASERKRVA